MPSLSMDKVVGEQIEAESSSGSENKSDSTNFRPSGDSGSIELAPTPLIAKLWISGIFILCIGLANKFF